MRAWISKHGSCFLTSSRSPRWSSLYVFRAGKINSSGEDAPVLNDDRNGTLPPPL